MALKIMLLMELSIMLTLLAPVVLVRGKLASKHPMLLLSAWHSSLLTAALALLLALGILIANGALAQMGSPAAIGWLDPLAAAILAWGALAILGVIGVRIWWQADALAKEAREAADRFSVFFGRSVRHMAMGRWYVRLVEFPVPIVAALPSPRGIIVSTEARDRLSERELRAVLWHEDTHLTHRHSAAITIGRLAQSCVPMLPAAERMAQATSLVVELIADDRAAAHSGAGNVASALVKLGGDSETTALRAARLRAGASRAGEGWKLAATAIWVGPLLPLAIAFWPAA
jgi:Zn-dependent protease with chaperone function